MSFINERFNIRKVLLFIVPLITLIISWHFNKLCFETNDDYYIMSFLAGFVTEKPIPDTVFCNIIWGIIVSTLYKIIPAIPWYTIIYMVIIYTSLVVIFEYCINIVEDRILYGALVFVWAFICIFCWYSTILQFTVIPAFAGMAAILVMAKEKSSPQCKIFSANFISFLFFAFIATILRTLTGYLFFIALLMFALSLRLFYNVKTTKKYVVTAGVFQIIAYVANAIYLKSPEWSTFLEYSAVRAKWTDYPRLAFEDAPELFQSVGWTKEFYELAKSWFFLDEHFTKEALMKINNSYDASMDKVTIGDAINALFSTGPTYFYISILLVILIIFYASIFGKKKKELLYLAGFLTVSFALLMYLALAGRIILRVVFVIILLFTIPAFCIVLSENEIKERICEKKYVKYPFLILGGILLCISLKNENGLYKDMSNVSSARMEENILIENVNNYVITHPDNFYIYDTSLDKTGNVFLTYKDKQPSNLKHWGGWQAYSPIDKKQLGLNGYESFYPDDFFDENVYFIASSADAWGIEYLLANYMEQRFPGCTLELVEQQPYINVYRFTR